MSLTPSKMLALGTPAPDFSLRDTVSGEVKSLNNLKSIKGTMVMFICNHCPYVIHINEKLVEIANTYMEKGISFIAISSNDAVKYPDDGPEKMALHAKENNYPFPYLYDKTQEVAKAYDAACTPDFYLFDRNMNLAYRGRMDGSTPGNNIENNGEDMIAALDAVLANNKVFNNQMPSMGCNIKWKTD